MDVYVLVLRFVHIVAGVFWAGAALAMGLFVGPAAQATGEAGQQVMRHLTVKAKFSTYMAAAGGLTVLAGSLLYWRDTNGLTSSWMTSGPGIGFGVGGATGVGALVAGLLMARYTSRLMRLGAAIAGQPTPDQVQRINAVGKSLATVGRFNLAFVTVTIVLMSLSRYLVF